MSAPAASSAAAAKPGRPRNVLDFGSAVASQLHHQLATLNKNTYSSNCMELERLLNRFGEEAYQLLLTLLVRDISATSLGNTFSSVSQSPEALKMKLLTQELQKLPKYPNFISIASGLITPQHLEGRQHFLQDLVKGASWPLPVQLALGLAFAHSGDPDVQADGHRFLKNKLGEGVLPNAVKTLPECLVYHLLYCIQTTEVFTEQAKILMQLESLRQSLLSLNPLNYGSKEMQQTKKKRDEDQSRLPAQCQDELSLAGVMEELGPGCTSTPAAFTSVVEIFTKITPKAVGRAVGLMAMTQGQSEAHGAQLHCQQAFYDSMHAVGAANAVHSAKSEKMWNIPNFVQVVKEHITEGPAFWHAVLRELDFAGLKLTSRGLNFIVTVTKTGTGGSELPVRHLLGDWEHTDVQLTILSLSLQAPPDLINFTTERKVQWEGAPAPWSSVDFVETLLNLSTPGLFQKVSLLFEPKEKRNGPYQKHPHLLLLVLLAAKPQLNELRRDFVKRLLADFLAGTGKPTQVELDLLTRAAKESLEALCHGLSDAFLDSPALAEQILNVAVEGKWIESLMNRCPSARLLSQIILLSGKRGGPENRLGGPQWLRKVLEGEVKVVPTLSTLARTLLACVELAPAGLPVSDIANVLAERATPGLSPQQKQHAASLATERNRASTQPAPAPAQRTGDSFPQEVEEEANNNFAKIYHQQMDVNLLIQQLQKCKECQPNTPQNNVYLCMVQNLFDEFRYFERYPAKELRITADLFGGIVAHNVLAPNRLAHALKFVLQNLHKPPHQNLQDFAVWALSKFMHRLPDWPQYCTLLQRVPNIEDMVEGIGKHLKSAIAGQQVAQQPLHPAQSGMQPANHEMGAAEVVQEQIKNIINQTATSSDPGHLMQCATELRAVLTAEHYTFFAEYLVQKKASMELNHHKLYIQLLDKIQQKELDTRVLQATYAMIKTHLASERIRTNSTERSLLKNLGSWLGLQTIGRNKPLMARDLDLKGLLFEAIMKGRLIAVVPFVAKVLEHSASSKVFRPPNPWLMGILSLLVDLHQLQDLKLTLKFEVEVLCKNINISLNELVDTQGVRAAQKEKLETIRMELQKKGDLDNSTDFNPAKRLPQTPVDQYINTVPTDDRATPTTSQQWNVTGQHVSTEESKLWQDNMQVRPTVPSAQVPGGLGSVPVLTGRANDLQDAYRPESLPEAVRLPSALAHLKKHVAIAIDKALKDVMQTVVDRNCMIACTTTRELVIKDYATEPDDSKLVKAAQQMVKALASHLAMVTCKDTLKLRMTEQLKVLLRGSDPPLDVAALEKIVMENLDVGVAVVEKAAADEASTQVLQYLKKHLDDRTRFSAEGGWKQDTFELLPEQNNDFIRSLPEPLRPKAGLLRAQKSVYEDFAKMRPRVADKDEHIERLDAILREIEQHTTAHYQNLNNNDGSPRYVLSLTHPSFTTASQSPQHEKIKKLLCSMPGLIKEDTATPFARHIFNKVFMSSDRLAQEQKNMGANPQSLYVVMLINEVCLFILQSARDKNTDRIVDELTRLFLSHEKRWHNKDIAVNFIRLRLIDVAEFNKHLTQALTVNEGEQHQRHVVEFASSIVQKCLVDEKLTSQKDLKSTLDALEKIARAAREQQAQQAQQQQQAQHQQAQQQQAQQQQAPPSPQAPMPPQAPQEQPASPSKPVPVVVPGSGPTTPTATTPTASGPTMVHPMVDKEEAKGLQQPTVKIPSLVASRAGGPETRAKVFQLLNDWMSICTRKQQPEGTDQRQFVAKLQQAGLLKADYMLDKFFALLTEISVEDYCSELKRQKEDKTKRQSVSAQNAQLYQAVDAFSDLIVLLIKCCAWTNGGRKEGDEKKDDGKSAAAEVALVNKVLSVVSKVLINNHDYHFNRDRNDAQQQVVLSEGQEPQDEFRQQPYFRFFSSLLLSLNSPQDPDSSHSTEILILFANQLHNLSPNRLPGFAFAWLELLCHRIFMPKLLFKNQEGWPHFERLLLDMLRFLEPWMRTARPTEAIRQLYKGTLKVLLVLLHDFPEFLCNYHFSFCDVLPPICIQMRNVILSSFPRQMKLPDPFSPNLKVDRLPEIAEPPTILSKYKEAMLPENNAAVTIYELDDFLRGQEPPGWLAGLNDRLRVKNPDETGCPYNTQLIHAIVLHTAIDAVSKPQEGENFLANSPAMALFKQLAQLEPVGRYYFIGALTNQLRFPNNHTHYFSCVILHLFLEDLPNQEAMQEQITRVLLERLIVNRPHPWGLLITFIELVKNPIYKFREKRFIHSSRDVEKLLMTCFSLGGKG